MRWFLLVRHLVDISTNVLTVFSFRILRTRWRILLLRLIFRGSCLSCLLIIFASILTLLLASIHCLTVLQSLLLWLRPLVLFVPHLLIHHLLILIFANVAHLIRECIVIILTVLILLLQVIILQVMHATLKVALHLDAFRNLLVILLDGPIVIIPGLVPSKLILVCNLITDISFPFSFAHASTFHIIFELASLSTFSAVPSGRAKAFLAQACEQIGENVAQL
mmetsp:Transcript_587/g.2077  ORF Transcript_587/g.2077 Transcript_587/m.2077 type:complete len:222 (-) Transcript_587:8007-8672(-)